MKTVDETMFMAAVIRAKEAGDYATNEEWAIRYAADKIKRLEQENERRCKAVQKVLTAWHKWRSLKNGGIPYIQHYKQLESAIEELQAALAEQDNE